MNQSGHPAGWPFLFLQYDEITQHTYTSNRVYFVTLVVWDGLSTATNFITIYVSPPSLAISSLSSGYLTLSWPSWAANYHLYSTTNLMPPALWLPVTNAITTNGNNFTLTLEADAAANRFLRLSSP